MQLNKQHQRKVPLDSNEIPFLFSSVDLTYLRRLFVAALYMRSENDP